MKELFSAGTYLCCAVAAQFQIGKLLRLCSSVVPNDVSMKSWLMILQICMLQQITCLRVTFVGAGPGTSALLTEAAKAALQQAQLVVADIGVHESVLKLAASAHVSKLSAPANAMDYLQQFSSDGHDVVRLLVGDPYMS
eukprot:20081-Heterococcus_DN1.PRE.1